MAGLDAYRRKRDFDATPEPPPESAPEPAPEPKGAGGLRFVVQMHAARRLHYDLRLEHEGALLSWAVPKGPSLDPGVRRLAVQTEDHPLAYADFEGTIPPGQYGAGAVLVWDRGVWIPEGDRAQAYATGHLRFRLEGEKLRGRWNLIRTKDAKTWLLIKSRDEFASRAAAAEIVETHPRSVVSGRSIEEVAQGSPAAGTPGNSPPPVLAPQLGTLVEQIPTGADWLHEIKLDGYRLMAHIGEGEVRLRTRGGEDWSGRLPSLVRELGDPALANTVLDGELCVLGPGGETRFELLQQALAAGREDELIYYVFDLPFASGKDLRGMALIERKGRLRALLDGLGGRGRHLRFCNHLLDAGPELLARACALGAEGIMSKRVNSTYEGRRSRAWRKVKCAKRMIVKVGGFTPPQGGRRWFGALLVGSPDQAGGLRYRGKVGSGLRAAALAQIHARLVRAPLDQPPFVDPPSPREARGVQWVAPDLAVEIEYSDLTEQGRVRHGRFKAICEGEGEGEAQPSVPQPATALRLTHPDKLLYPRLGLRKRDVADYMMQVAQWILPHVRDRALTLVRCPEGVEGGCFYQKHAMPGLPSSIARVRVRESKGREVVYAQVVDALGLVGLVQMSVLELHIWGSRVDAIERPDRLVFDLDPDEGLEFARVVDGAFEVRERLAGLGLTSFVKTTGGKGLHVVAPIERDRDFVAIKQFCQGFAAALAKQAPTRYTARLAKAERRGKIFIDYLRNGRGATSVAPYSPRARPEALVSTPLRWEELTAELRPEAFTLRTVPARLAGLERDPWDRFFELRQSVEDAGFRALQASA